MADEVKHWVLKLDSDRYGNGHQMLLDRRAPTVIVHGTRKQAEELRNDLDFVEAGCTDLYVFDGED